MPVRVLDPPASLFKTSASAVVIPVNVVGTAGAGLARTAARLWPEWALAYKRDCAAKLIVPGDCVSTIKRARRDGMPTFVLSAATKNHWREPSRIAWVEECLVHLAAWATGARGAIDGGVGVPALGCGNGGLPWLGGGGVRAMSERILGPVPVTFLLFAPHDDGRDVARHPTSRGRDW